MNGADPFPDCNKSQNHSIPSIETVALASSNLFNVSIYFSNFPVAGTEQEVYIRALMQAVRSIVRISQAWNITIIQQQPINLKRIHSQVLNQQLYLIFTSCTLSSDSSDARSLEMKVESADFIQRLNEMGFKASLSSMNPFQTQPVADLKPNSTNGSYSNSSVFLEEHQSSEKNSTSIIIASCASVGIVAIFLMFLLGQKLKSLRLSSKMVPKTVEMKVAKSTVDYAQDHNISNNCNTHTQTFSEDSKEKLHNNAELNEIIQHLAGGVVTKQVSISSFADLATRQIIEEPATMDQSMLDDVRNSIRNCDCTYTDTINKDANRENLHGFPYHDEMNEIVQRLVITGLSISSSLDRVSRQMLEETSYLATDLDPYQCAAILQQISEIEINTMLNPCLSHDENEQLHIEHQGYEIQGAYSESLSFFFKVINDMERLISGPDTLDTELKDAPGCGTNEYLTDVIQLLTDCGLEAKHLIHEEGRKIIENSILRQTVPQNENLVCLLQLLGMMELKSSPLISTERQVVLRNRIGNGRLSHEHMSQMENFIKMVMNQGNPWPNSGAHAPGSSNPPSIIQIRNDAPVSQWDSSSTGVQEELPKANVKQTCICDEDQRGLPLFVLSSKETQITGSISKENEINTKSKISILNQEDKHALMLLELKSKAASIWKSLPEWVKNGTLPPQQSKHGSSRASNEKIPEWVTGFGSLLRPQKRKSGTQSLFCTKQMNLLPSAKAVSTAPRASRFELVRNKVLQPQNCHPPPTDYSCKEIGPAPANFVVINSDLVFE